MSGLMLAAAFTLVEMRSRASHDTDISRDIFSAFDASKKTFTDYADAQCRLLLDDAFAAETIRHQPARP